MIQSTMQRLVAENARLRRTGTIDRVVYWFCLASVLVIAMLKLAGVNI